MLAVNRFGSLIHEREHLYFGLAVRKESRIIEGIEGPDPGRYNLGKISMGIDADILDVNKWIGFILIYNK